MAILNILRTLGNVYDHLVHLCWFGTFTPVLVSCTKKNLATLLYIAPFTCITCDVKTSALAAASCQELSHVLRNKKRINLLLMLKSHYMYCISEVVPY
jgi:hypothetical protein